MKKILIAAVALSLALCGCSSAGGQVNTQETPAPVSEATAAPTEAPSQQVKLGESFSFGNWNITIEGCSYSEVLHSDTGINEQAEDNNVFLMVYLITENTGKERESIFNMYHKEEGDDLQVVYADGYKYEPALSYSLNDIFRIPVSPLEEKHAKVAFVVPKKVVEDAEHPLVLRFGKGGDYATFDLGTPSHKETV